MTQVVITIPADDRDDLDRLIEVNPQFVMVQVDEFWAEAQEVVQLVGPLNTSVATIVAAWISTRQTSRRDVELDGVKLTLEGLGPDEARTLVARLFAEAEDDDG